MKILLPLALASLVLTACAPKAGPPADLATLAPADPRLAQLYADSCKACHTVADSGAPLVHDHDAWDPRWQKGLPTLVTHAITGFQAMPAGGQCSACTREDYEKLIRFMADEDKP